ncbi:MAG: carbonate dehydratase [Chlamydiae bacterium]|nr:carbonate dehydratase [Chlamydiota bacterium]
MEKLKILFQNNEDWVHRKIAIDPSYFKTLARDQSPDYLWIGCSDSRVPANEIVGLEPGELFVHRNVANIFPHTDFNCLSVLEFAVNILQVRHVIVCGHYGCGGVNAAMRDHHLGLVDNWLRNIRDVYSKHKEELEAIPNEKARQNRLVELNVLQQVLNVCHTTIVQEAWEKNQFLCIHGWVYNLESGMLEDLKCCISGVKQVDTVYQVRFKH